MDSAIPMIRKRYEEVYLDKTHFLDGAKEVLETLYHKTIALALASNKFGRFSRGALTHLGVSGYFKSIFGAGDGPRNKPYPDMIHASLKAMDLPPETVIFVGDSLQDIETGRCRCLCPSHGRPYKEGTFSGKAEKHLETPR